MEMHSRTTFDRNKCEQSLSEETILSHSRCRYHYDLENKAQISMSTTSKFQKTQTQKRFALDPLGSS